MARKRATLTDLLNDLTFRVIYDKYKLVSMNAFKWEGLPGGITEKHIERELFDHGKAVFFIRPESHRPLVLKVDDGGKVNVQGDPLNYRASGVGKTWDLRDEECVIIENNKLRLATRDFVMFYVNKLTEAERTMDVNVKANKTPVVVLCDDKDVLSLKRIFQQVDGNAPAIFADRSLTMENMQALDLKAKFLGNDLMNYKKAVENELLTFLGLNNTPQEKKERLITDEANSNNQLIMSFSDLQLEARQRACEEINEKFGFNITVCRRNELVENSVETVENSDEEVAS